MADLKLKTVTRTQGNNQALKDGDQGVRQSAAFALKRAGPVSWSSAEASPAPQE